MSKGFVLEFSVDVGPRRDPLAGEKLLRLRVIVDEVSSAYEAYDDAFGGLAWARVIGSLAHGARARAAGPDATRWTSSVTEEGIIALAIRGYINADRRIFEQLPNGREIIKLGTVKGEA